MTKRTDIYLLRAVRSDGAPPVAHSTFRWPLTKGVDVVCPDWDPAPVCGNGLHGWVAGEVGSVGGVQTEDTELRWLVFRAKAEDVVNLEGKAKAKQGRVVYVAKGTGVEARQRAVQWLESRGKAGPACAWISRLAGWKGTATAGWKGTATAGDRGTATAGWKGTATAGEYGTLRIKYYAKGRYRWAVAYVGEEDILPNTAYKLTAEGAFVLANPTTNPPNN